jgi:hypothetical protein
MVQQQTPEEIRAFARRLVEADKAAIEMKLKGFWKDLAREILASTTDKELDEVGRCIAGYNRTGKLEEHEQYQILIELGERRRQEIK